VYGHFPLASFSPPLLLDPSIMLKLHEFDSLWILLCTACFKTNTKRIEPVEFDYRWVKCMHFCQIQHNFTCSEYLCRLGKISKCTDMQVLDFFGQNFKTFDILHDFLPSVTVVKLSSLKTVRFSDHLVC